MPITIEQLGVLGALIISLIALFKDIQKTRSDLRKDDEEIGHTTYSDLLELYKLVKQQRDELQAEVDELKKQVAQRDSKISELILKRS